MPTRWLLIACIILCLSAANLFAAGPPNIVLIISDDQAWTDYGFMGHEHIRTPHLDRLAKESRAFTRGYVPDSLCRPSLATIISGLYPHQHRIVGNDPPPPADIARLPKGQQRRDPRYRQRELDYINHVDTIPRLAAILGERGYVSHQSGKWWEGHFSRGGFTHGMTHGDLDRGARHGDAGLTIGRQGMQPVFNFIDAAVADQKPFFVYYAPFLPHTPHTPPQRLLDKYLSKTPHEPVAKYWAMCEWFDETCGALLKHLDDRRLADDTIVVYVTDNGWINLEDQSAYAPRSKRSQYDGGTRTPIMIRWPGKVAPKFDTERLASSIDIVPTLLKAVGLPPTDEMQGINLLDDAAVSARNTIFGEIFEHDIVDMVDPVASLRFRWIIDGNWKLILPHPAREPDADVELFDIVDDPFEAKNLAAERPAIVERLIDKIEGWWKVGAVAQGESADGLSAKDAVPHWIWSSTEPKDGEVALFRKEFRLEGRITSARLYAAGDDELRVFLNGKPLVESAGWDQVASLDIASKLARGRNVFAIRGKNGTSAAGVLLKLDVETDRQGAKSVITDESWQTAGRATQGWQNLNFDAPNWKPAVSVGALGAAPWTKVNAELLAGLVNLREPTATPIENIVLPKGFRAELLYTVPKDEQGSWVNMCVDPQGRLIVSDQYGKLYRVTLPHLVEGLDELKIEPIDVEIGEAQGLLWAFDSLYVMVNTGGKFESGLYRVTDSDGDDRLDTVTLLRALEGKGEHGPHAILKTPDGQGLYVVCGNGTKITHFDQTRVPPIWNEDLLLPRVLGRFMVGVPAPGGWIARIDPEGKEWELVASGFRNQFDAALNLDGDLFTFDADMEWDINTPWYRPTRVCQVVSGAEFGWRSSAGKWPEYYLDSVGPTINIGPGSPTGVTFGYGAKFPEKYQRAYYACDWSYGILYAVHMQSHGAGYEATAEKFITGSPLPLTDILIHPRDGAMYFTIGGRRVQSGLYRITYDGPEPTAPISASTEANPARELRRTLEAFHGGVHPQAVATAWPALGHEDRLVRYAARVALEFQPLEHWQQRALKETDPLASLTALTALVRVAGESPAIPELGKPEPRPAHPELLPAVLDALSRIEWASLSHDRRIDLVRVTSLALTRLGGLDDARRKSLIDRFDPVFPAESPELNNGLCELLVYLQAPTAAAKGLKLLLDAPTQEEQIAYAKSLRHLNAGWTTELKQSFLEWFVKAMGYRGGASFATFVGNIRNEFVEKLTPAEKEQFQAILTAVPVEQTSAIIAEPRPLVKKWTLEELIPLIDSGLKGRDFDRGRKMFGAANCYACHRFRNEGGAIGPDLTGLGGRFSPRDMLESIIDPSKEISDQYAATQFLLTDGRVIVGRIANLAGDDFRVITNMYDPGNMTNVDRKLIDEMFPSKASMMPNGLLNTLHEDEILDLLAYLLSRGDREHAMFKK